MIRYRKFINYKLIALMLTMILMFSSVAGNAFALDLADAALGKGEINYTYTGALLTGIQSESTQYTLTYDVFGNTKSIKAGNNTLASYDYNLYNGKLNKLTYGNGDYVEYKYDSLDKVSSIWYTNGGDNRENIYELMNLMGR